MEEGLTWPLARAALMVAVASYLIVARDVGRWVAAALALIRVGLTLAYFSWFFDGSWTLLDDVTYAQQGEQLLRLGYTPLEALIDTDVRSGMMALAGGQHFLYLWWNLLAQTLFGAEYSSAVFLNVFLTFFTGFILFRLLRLMDFSREYARLFEIFFLLHWEVLAWSSIINLKDVLVMTLTAAGLYLLVRLARGFHPIPFLALGLVILLFSYTRFYIPALIILAFGIWLLAQWQNRRKYLLFPLLAVVLFLLIRPYTEDLEHLEPAGLLFGTLRFALTPQPWSLDENYSFLLIPSILHWFMFIPALVAARTLWSHSRPARLLIVYLAVTVLFYATVPEVQGPRHRVQVSFIVAWLQFHFLRGLLDLRQTRAFRIAPSRPPPPRDLAAA